MITGSHREDTDERQEILGFSLIEVVLALAVISFALVGIMGLFPVAMRSAQESQRDTRAALIAQSIVSDLSALPGTNTFVVRGPSATNSSWRIENINLSRPTNFVLAYSEKGEGLTTVVDPSVFSNPVAGASFVALVDVSTNDLIPGLSRVVIRVEAPAAASSTNRSANVFVTLMDQN